ncbi:hypothetical protein BJ138DRAFT_1155256 [Hygrophoropsis aurantiaca]|uniref:Uncharacterized protein n=1 Tax=Hygrophoropsis aurantiaca TaxID=72124 RepID=A0ACB8A7G7_9AGAM|nr:hypothetical protein BJ138DRAFT_1155256 [Hygrophoropsis aurantiaca]
MPNISKRQVLLVQAASTPASSEFIAHPDYRQVAAFFLGWVFLYSVYCLVLYAAGRIYTRIHRVPSFSFVPPPRNNLTGEILWNDREKLGHAELSPMKSPSRNAISDHDHSPLTAMLSSCFAFASVANFSSLLTFNVSSGPSACAFVVAWAGISGVCARIIGLLILVLELRKLETKRWESCFFCGWLLAALAMVFATYTISIGVVEFIPQLDTYLCYRVRYLPTALTTSLIFLFFELYFVIRFFRIIAPSFLAFHHRVGALADTRILRSLSLVLLELLTIVPGSEFIGIVADFVPFSISALIVLASFHRPVTMAGNADRMSICSAITVAAAIPGGRKSRPQRPSLGGHLADRPFSTHVANAHAYTAEKAAAMTFSPTRSISNNSTHSLDTVTAQSIKAAVVHVASRTKYIEVAPRLLSPTSVITAVPILSEPSLSNLRALPSPQREVAPITPQSPPQCHDNTQHMILDQQAYADQLERDNVPKRVGLPIRPRLTIATSPPQQLAGPPRTPSSRSKESVRYGSDIIYSRSLEKVDMTKDTSRRPTTHAAPSIASYASPMDTSMQSPNTIHSHSWSTVIECLASPQEAPPLPISQDVRRLTFGPRTPSCRSSTFPISPIGAQASRSMRQSTIGEPPSKALARILSRRTVRPLPILAQAGNYSIDDGIESAEIRARHRMSRIRGPRPPPKVFSPVDETPLRDKFFVDGERSHRFPGTIV